MKVSFFLILSVASIFHLPFSRARSDPAFDFFLQCLPKHTQSSNTISESIYTPNNSSFQFVFTAYVKNRRFLTAETLKPLAIIAAKHESHVQATVVCSKGSGLEIRIRSGGHDYEGLSYTSTVPFVILDMFNLRAIDIDVPNRIAWVQAGATLGELYYKISQSSKILGFPAGVCPTLGVGGHFSGGGYGNMIRKYGLSVDNIVDAKIVDVQGRILDKKSMGKDLFWAIRGAGGASFGVILSWKIMLVPVPEKVTAFNISRTVEQGATDVVYRWQTVAPTLPRDIFVRAVPSKTGGSQKGEKTTVKVLFYGTFLGQPQSLMEMMKNKFPELGLQVGDCKEMSWVESTMFWTGIPLDRPNDLLNRPQGTNNSLKRKSDYVKSVIPKEGLEKIWKKMIDLDAHNFWMQWNPYGGRMNEISESRTPFPHRAGILFKIQYSVSWEGQGINVTNHYINELRDFYASMASYVSSDPREAFLNYRDLDVGSISTNQTSFKDAQVYGFKYFKRNFRRLVDVKSKVDPDNFFKNEQSIPSANYLV